MLPVFHAQHMNYQIAAFHFQVTSAATECEVKRTGKRAASRPLAPRSVFCEHLCDLGEVLFAKTTAAGVAKWQTHRT